MVESKYQNPFVGGMTNKGVSQPEAELGPVGNNK